MTTETSDPTHQRSSNVAREGASRAGVDRPAQGSKEPRRARSGQATKSMWWMPRHQEAMKDVFTCEKPRRAGRELRPVDVRMGKPSTRHGVLSHTEYIGMRGQRGEVKHLSTPRKRNQPRLRK